MNGGRAILRSCQTLTNRFSAVKNTPRIAASSLLVRSKDGHLQSSSPAVRNFSVHGSRLMGSGSVGDGGTSVLTPELKQRIDEMVKESDVVVFMKVSVN